MSGVSAAVEGEKVGRGVVKADRWLSKVGPRDGDSVGKVKSFLISSTLPFCESLKPELSETTRCLSVEPNCCCTVGVGDGFLVK